MLWGCVPFSSLHAQELFADQCVGTWEGMMLIYANGHVRDSVQVTFTAEPTDTAGVWTWKTAYHSPTRPMVKDYLLRLVDSTTQQYATDEGDGIVLHDYLFGHKLYSVFETSGILLTASYERVGEHLIFEVTSGKKLDEAEVSNYSVTHVQRVVLTRK